MDRRTTIKWVLAASVAGPAVARSAFAVAPVTAPVGARVDHAPNAVSGYGTDPKLLASYHAGDFWPLTLTAPQRTLATTLCDLILPADEHSPAASAVGVVDFIDEWISAPYPGYQADRKTVLQGFEWLDGAASHHGAASFAQLPEREQHAICDQICDVARAAPAQADAAHFFALYRNLTAGGFYSTPAGRKDVRYIGNVALPDFPPPPHDLLQKLQLV
ncbi:MAG: gluconate 2-dehydrogenase subunit 3 family protein [Sinobacteraceae bacterium]|nr:gluconate 2-dehydrogenase subunit 3 family protein [Nevskiaceae bacterium]